MDLSGAASNLASYNPVSNLLSLPILLSVFGNAILNIIS